MKQKPLTVALFLIALFSLFLWQRGTAVGQDDARIIVEDADTIFELTTANGLGSFDLRPRITVHASNTILPLSLSRGAALTDSIIKIQARTSYHGANSNRSLILEAPQSSGEKNFNPQIQRISFQGADSVRNIQLKQPEFIKLVAAQDGPNPTEEANNLNGQPTASETEEPKETNTPGPGPEIPNSNATVTKQPTQINPTATPKVTPTLQSSKPDDNDQSPPEVTAAWISGTLALIGVILAALLTAYFTHKYKKS